MMTIGQVSEHFGIPISTLRYYDREGLFPDMERQSGIRHFGARELEALRVIECLKASKSAVRNAKSRGGGGNARARKDARYASVQMLVLRNGDCGRQRGSARRHDTGRLAERDQGILRKRPLVSGRFFSCDERSRGTSRAGADAGWRSRRSARCGTPAA